MNIQSIQISNQSHLTSKSGDRKDMQQETETNIEELHDIVQSVNSISEHSVKFDISEEPPFIKIVDNNGNVIKEIPPQDIRELKDIMQQLSNKGTIIDTMI